MKVSGSDPLSRLRDLLRKIEEPERSAKTEEAGPTSTDRATDAAGGDSFQLSGRAREIQNLRQTLEASPDVRQELVQRLREEIASGNYRIDGSRIVDGLLEEMLDQ